MKPVHNHLKRLQYEDALEKGEAQRHDPLDGLLSAILKAIQQSKERGHSADGQQQEPAQEHTPPGQPAAWSALLSLHRRGAEGGDKREDDLAKSTATDIFTEFSYCFELCLEWY